MCYVNCVKAMLRGLVACDLCLGFYTAVTVSGYCNAKHFVFKIFPKVQCSVDRDKSIVLY